MNRTYKHIQCRTPEHVAGDINTVYGCFFLINIDKALLFLKSPLKKPIPRKQTKQTINYHELWQNKICYIN